jgi:hypothetical protein
MKNVKLELVRMYYPNGKEFAAQLNCPGKTTSTKYRVSLRVSMHLQKDTAKPKDGIY